MIRYVAALLLVFIAFQQVRADPSFWRHEWPQTDFTKTAIDFMDVRSGGPPKDGIPAIDRPRFVDLTVVEGLGDDEPVIGLEIDGDVRAYPIRILMWHEIVNDTVGGLPVAVTFCPLCNSGIVFDRRVGDRVLDFGTTGKLRNSDLIMYDRQTESWWQQFVGEAIVGEMTGKELAEVPARLESFDRFKQRFAGRAAKVLIPTDPNARSYGRNPYEGYDTLDRPWLYNGDMPDGIEPMARVVAVGGKAWSLELLRAEKELRDGDLRLRWAAGQNSALDTARIEKGRDVGNVIVEERHGDGWRDVSYHVAFAFAFHAFHPDSKIRVR